MPGGLVGFDGGFPGGGAAVCGFSSGGAAVCGFSGDGAAVRGTPGGGVADGGAPDSGAVGGHQAHVGLLERRRRRPQALDGEVACTQPACNRRHRGGCDRPTHLVLAGECLVHLGQRHAGRSGQLGERKPWWCGEPDGLAAGCSGQLGWCSPGDGSPAGHDHHLVGQVLGLGELVGGEHDARAAGPLIGHHLPDDQPPFGVHAGGGLVQEQDLGSADQRERQAEPLLLPAGEPAPRGPGHRAECHEVEQGIGVVGIVVVASEQVQCLTGAHGRVDPAALEHHPDPADQLPVVGDRIEPEDPHGPGIWSPVALQGLHRRGLARTVGPQDGQDLAMATCQRQPADGGDRAVAHHQVVARHGDFGATARTVADRSVGMGAGGHGAEATVGRTMIDIRLVRQDVAAVRAALARRGVDPAEVDALAAEDEEARQLVAHRDELRAQVNALSKQVGEARRAGEAERAEELAGLSRRLGDELRAVDGPAEAAAGRVRERLLWLPNLPSDDAPDGAGPHDNPVVRRWPDAPRTYADHQRVPHWDVAAALGILDLERGARLSGSMFPAFRGMGSRLLRALTALALDRHADAFEEVRPPTLVRTETMMSTGHLPKFADEAYAVERDGLWAIPTAEVPLTSMYRGEIIEEERLPLRLTAATACFRREAGAAGRDTRGLLRVHEFDKVELFAYATTDQAPAVHADMVGRVEALVQALGLEYRVLDLCTGDLGNSSARTFDIEVYAPGCDMWLEVSSISWFRDYQARRADVRYRPAGGGSPRFVDTLNGSGLAWARIWAALVEVGRQPDGSVELPEVLAPYLGGTRTIG